MNSRFSIKLRLVTMIGVVSATILAGGYFLGRDVIELHKSFEENKRMQDMLRAVNLADLSATNFNLVAMDMLVDSLHSDFKGLDKKRYDYLAKQKLDLDATVAAMKENVAFFGLEAPSKVLIDDLNALSQAVHGLSAALKSQRPSESELAKYDVAIDSNKEDALAKIELMMSAISEKSSALAAHQNESLDRMTRSAVVTAILVFIALLVSGVSTMRSLMSSMRKVHGNLSKSSDDLRVTSDSLAESSQRMASATAESAAAIQESVSSMAEMTAMLKQTSQHTESAASLAQDILSRSDEGSRVMSDLSDSMGRIATANAKLEDITKIIDDIRGRANLINDIVFKTQLLSVNASIEAARAGHHGKGFAVVANEVANLATMSGKAANEIGSLLHESVSKVASIVDGTAESVQGGEQTCKNAVKMFSSISKSIGDISEKVSQIDVATKEQEAGIRQTSAALAQMNAATTSTSHVARENAQLGGQLLRHCDRMTSVNRLLGLTVFGEDVRSSAPELDSHSHRDPGMAFGKNSSEAGREINNIPANVVHLNTHELASKIINRVKSSESSSVKYTGTDD